MLCVELWARVDEGGVNAQVADSRERWPSSGGARVMGRHVLGGK